MNSKASTTATRETTQFSDKAFHRVNDTSWIMAARGIESRGGEETGMVTNMCLAIREVTKNYSGYLATKIAIFAFEHANRHYVAIAGDSRPFTSLETLKIGVTPNLSTANAGSQRGSGTKMAAAMVGPDGEGCLIFISNTIQDGLKAVSGRRSNGNGWEIENVDQKLVSKVKSIIDKETELLNVVTIFEVKYTKGYCSDSVPPPSS